MNPTTHNALINLLERDFEFKQVGDYLRKGVCPTCNKKSLFTWFEKPWVLVCERANKCGTEYHVKELFPALFDDWGKRFPKTEANPTASADAYMVEGRGFELALVKGWYTQESYYDQRIGAGSATIRFALPAAGPAAYWERIIDQAQRFGDRKATFGGQYGGTWWCPPTLDLSEAHDGAEVWIVEGIFDAIALMHKGIRAVAAMSCNNYPQKCLDALREQFNGEKAPTLVWALDGDTAGQRFTKKWVEKCKEQGWECKAAQIEQKGKAKLDWNDMHQRGRLEAQHQKEYLYQGALLLASSATDKALLMYQKMSRGSFAFEFAQQLWWFKFDQEKFGKAQEALRESSDLEGDELRDQALRDSGGITHLCNANPTALYFQQNTITDESWYYFKVEFPTDQPSIKATFTGSQVSASAEFKKRMLSIAPGAVFKGTTGQLDTLMEYQLKGIKTVQTIDYVGYSKEHDAWVYQDLCIKDGKVNKLNSEDYFELGKLSLKTLSQSVRLHLNTEAKEFNTSWVDMLWTSFNSKAIVALAFWLGALYAEQIRTAHKSFPFIEIVGQPGSGKTTLIEFLWKLLGRVDYEGFDPSKSTPAARSRNFAQVSNLPVVLIEGDRGEGARSLSFDWDELKTAYNGRASRSTGVKNGGNETKEPPFRGAIVISQNAEVSASDAILERICHMFFDKAEHSPQGKAASDALSRMPVEELSYFLVKATSDSAKVLATFAEKFAEYEADMQKNSGIKNIRIIKNHAQIRALVDCLHVVMPSIPKVMLDAAHNTIGVMSKEREQACAADHPLVAEFWDTYDFLNGQGEEDTELLNHSRGENGVIAISLPHFAQVCVEKRLPCPPLADLKRVLSTSRHRKFLEVRTVNSGINAKFNQKREALQLAKPTAVKCWVFTKGVK